MSGHFIICFYKLKALGQNVTYAFVWFEKNSLVCVFSSSLIKTCVWSWYIYIYIYIYIYKVHTHVFIKLEDKKQTSIYIYIYIYIYIFRIKQLRLVAKAEMFFCRSVIKTGMWNELLSQSCSDHYHSAGTVTCFLEQMKCIYM